MLSILWCGLSMSVVELFFYDNNLFYIHVLDVVFLSFGAPVDAVGAIRYIGDMNLKIGFLDME